MDTVEALKQLGGIARAADIVALSSRRRLRTAVSNKAIIHVDRDRYALPVTDLGKRLAVKHNLTSLTSAPHSITAGRFARLPSCPISSCRADRRGQRARPGSGPTMPAHANGSAANAFESGLRAITAAAGYEFIPQYEVRVGALTVHPDLVDPINGIIVEADSWSFHADREAHDRDCRRYTMLASDGWIVLRFTYDQVMFQPEYVLRCIEMALSQRAAAA